jgi:DNA-binding transcriptional MerR regulator
MLARMAEALKIGEVAERGGITVDAVRFYERRGVLPAPVRRASGYRQYSEATIERIRFVKSLQALGFTLDEITDVLRAVDAGVASCERERPRFESVLARIDQKIGALTAIRRDLLATLKRCRDGNCTFLEEGPRETNGSVQRGRPRNTQDLARRLEKRRPRR